MLDPDWHSGYRKKAQGYTVGRQRPGNLHSSANNQQAGIKASRATAHRCTQLQMCSPEAAPERGLASGWPLNVLTQLLQARGEPLVCTPGVPAAQSRCGQAAPAPAQAGDSMRSIHGAVSFQESRGSISEGYSHCKSNKPLCILTPPPLKALNREVIKMYIKRRT